MITCLLLPVLFNFITEVPAMQLKLFYFKGWKGGGKITIVGRWLDYTLTKNPTQTIGFNKIVGSEKYVEINSVC